MKLPEGLRRDYWDALNDVLDKVDGPVKGNRKPQDKSSMDYKALRPGSKLQAGMNTIKHRVQVRIWIGNQRPEKETKAIFDCLERQKEAIKQELGTRLKWEPAPCDIQSWIALRPKESVDPKDKSDWPRQHEWLAKGLNDVYRVFSRRVKDC